MANQRRGLIAAAIAVAVLGAGIGFLIAAVSTTESAVVSASSSPTPSPTPVVTTTEVADGLTLTTIADPEGPQRIWVLDMDPESRLTLDASLVRDGLGGKGPLTRIAARGGAIAAVNGDYGISIGRPLHLFAADGELLQTSLINNTGRNVAWSADASEVYFGRPRVSIAVTPPHDRTPFSVAAWNDGAPGADDVTGFTAAAGGVAVPPPDSCAVRMIPAGPPEWSAGQEAIERSYEVVAGACRDSPMIVGSEGAVLVAQADGNRVRAMQAFTKGEEVKLSWGVAKWPGVLDAVGGSALLVEGGRVVTEKCHGNYECWRHPRTGIGVTAEGHILLVVVDGRREGWSIGMRRESFAALMFELGAIDAMALDGGASSEMVINGQVVNQPSGNEERRLMSAILILPGPDAGDPSSLTGSPLPIP